MQDLSADRLAAADHVVHAEIFFDPQTHTARGIAMGTVIHGLKRARDRAEAELGISSALILCFLRHLSEHAYRLARNSFAPPAARARWLERLNAVFDEG